MGKPSIPKGTRDFSPQEMARRNFIFDTIRAVFRKYGYQQIETPAMEMLETLTGKYGEEGDRLIFKILNSGDYLKDIPGTKLQGSGSRELTPLISEKALRYDLTVPFARYVVQHQNDIVFPFKRFQVQPVWRADKPQKGRYREFCQCDVDVIGSDSLLNEVELIRIMDEVFDNLKVGDAIIHINNRKVLFGFAELWGMADRFTEFAGAIDKKDKIGVEGVFDELNNKGLIDNSSFIEKLDFKELQNFFNHALGNEASVQKTMDWLAEFGEKFGKTNTGQKGFEEIRTLFQLIGNCGSDAWRRVIFDASLARGLSYYTGTIFEVRVSDYPSICGGGRYDDLTGIFGLPGVSGVGVSFGADRIYDVLLEKNLFPDFEAETTQVMFVNFGEREALHCLGLLNRLHKQGINAELYPDAAKMKKQMKYADAKSVAHVVLVGEEEMQSGRLSVKNMTTGEQQDMSLEEMIKMLKK